LQRLLGDSVEVINLGVGGKDPSNYIDFLSFFPIGRGDKVVVILYDNDIHMSQETCELTMRQQKEYPIFSPSFCPSMTQGLSNSKDKQGLLNKANQLFKEFKVFQLAKESSYNIPYFSNMFYRTDFINRWNQFSSEENRWIVSTIPVMRSIAKARDAQFILTYYPNTNLISPEDRRHDIWLNFATFVSNNTGIQLNDPYFYFIETAPRKSMVWSLTDKHPSCDAHLIMAKYLYDLMK